MLPDQLGVMQRQLRNINFLPLRYLLQDITVNTTRCVEQLGDCMKPFGGGVYFDFSQPHDGKQKFSDPTECVTNCLTKIRTGTDTIFWNPAK